MDPNLEHLILTRLADDQDVDERTTDLVLAACEGASALRAALAGEGPRRLPTEARRTTVVEPPGAYLSAVAVEGFRGIAGRVELPLTSGPGLTLVVGQRVGEVELCRRARAVAHGGELALGRSYEGVE